MGGFANCNCHGGEGDAAMGGKRVLNKKGEPEKQILAASSGRCRSSQIMEKAPKQHVEDQPQSTVFWSQIK
jgi:hypothetical protein